MLRRDVVNIAGYREDVAEHFRQILPASLTISWIVCFGEPFLIGLRQAASVERVGWSSGVKGRLAEIIVCCDVRFASERGRFRKAIAAR